MKSKLKEIVEDIKNTKGSQNAERNIKNGVKYKIILPKSQKGEFDVDYVEIFDNKIDIEYIKEPISDKGQKMKFDYLFQMEK